MIRETIQILLRYLVRYWPGTAVAAYMLMACILKIFTPVDITIPCLFSLIFGVHCPGCGLTRAFMQVLQLNFVKAWEFNPLIFIILPFGSLYLVRDFMRFRKRRLMQAKIG